MGLYAVGKNASESNIKVKYIPMSPNPVNELKREVVEEFFIVLPNPLVFLQFLLHEKMPQMLYEVINGLVQI